MNDQIYKNWRKDVGTDYETTRKLVDEDYTRANTSRNTENELVEMNKKLTGATAMTNDGIIRMAKEAGFADGIPEIMGLEGFYNFAALVAAAERERCCAIVFGMAGSDNVAQRTVEKIRERSE